MAKQKKPEKAEKAEPNLAYATEITRQLYRLQELVAQSNPDGKHNTGRMIGEAYFWDTVEKLAKAKSDSAWDRLASMGVALDEDADPGNHVIGNSPHFVVECSVSQPRKAFNIDVAAENINKTWPKVPIPAVKLVLDQAKIGGSKVKTYKIVEK